VKRALRRLGAALVSLWLVASVTFVASELLPSDPARLLAGPQARAADVERVRRQLDLDAPALVRYGRFFRRLVAGPTEPVADARFAGLYLGTSARYRRPVAALVAERLPRSLELAVVALALEVALALALAAESARKPRGPLDLGSLALAVAASSVPLYLLGIGLQYVFAYRLGLLPLDGVGATASEHLRALVLPALCLGLYGAGPLARVARDEVRAALASDAVRTARAKGAGPGRVFLVHALRIATLPFATILALDFGVFLGGALVTEALFRWPGLASLVVDGALERDGPVVLGVTFVLALFVVGAQLTVDLAAPLLDPRLRR
jgi:peptide/nickel transport system permease protein